MHTFQIHVLITNSYTHYKFISQVSKPPVACGFAHSCTYYKLMYTLRRHLHRQTQTNRHTHTQRERVRERERERPAPDSISRLHNNGIFVYMYICIYVYMYICIHAYINIVVCVYTAVYRPCGPELAQGHRVSRPRGTGSVDDSVGEGSLLPCTQNPKD